MRQDKCKLNTPFIEGLIETLAVLRKRRNYKNPAAVLKARSAARIKGGRAPGNMAEVGATKRGAVSRKWHCLARLRMRQLGVQLGQAFG